MNDSKKCQRCKRNKKKHRVELRISHSICVCAKCKKKYYGKNGSERDRVVTIKKLDKKEEI